MPSLYGITISIAILSCLYATERIFPERKKFVWDAGLYCVIGGIIGARLYHVIDYADIYLSNPQLILAIWNGGLGIWGAVIGGAIGLYIYSCRHRESFLENTGVIATVLPLGQAVGRWGNFFNSELAGTETKLPWSIDGRHPLFFYESVLNLVLFALLVKNARAQKPKSLLLSIYLAGYGIIRFFLEFLRVEPWKIGVLNVAQMASILAVMLSAIIYLKGHRS